MVESSLASTASSEEIDLTLQGPEDLDDLLRASGNEFCTTLGSLGLLPGDQAVHLATLQAKEHSGASLGEAETAFICASADTLKSEWRSVLDGSRGNRAVQAGKKAVKPTVTGA
ncbi:MAG: hypothetical protein Greene041662_82 [Candidatus Peregrinibacteria bacterium Greene0416_62]|nr:MAG: hypothetical protein Greene041662_82 [Candidatus Peregrinibacteria bacterium Greene0416_62]TSC97070.1 MAG: hypothetical protein Greene101449_1309 [Candidatus Peregrinibacteria bacterium Greene1014_49]